MPKKKSESDDPQAVPFEEALQQLKTVVNQLENGNLTLSQSLEQYEQGVKNLKSCYAALEQAQKKIELLVRLDKDGNLITRSFDDSATRQTTRKTTRKADYLDDSFEDEVEEIADEDPNYEDADVDDSDVDDPHRLF